MVSQLNKTKMCKFELKGMCTKGSNCPFAHNQLELQPLPDLSCSKFCMTLRKTGRCDDPQCTYAHHEKELRTGTVFYKTKVCQYWLAKGNCSLGSSCYFAHSGDELRPACGFDETGSTAASSNNQQEDSSRKPSLDLTSDYAQPNLGSYGQEMEDKNDVPRQRGRNQRQPRQQKSSGGQKPRGKIGDKPQVSTVQDKHKDAFSFMPFENQCHFDEVEPFNVHSESKVDSVLSMFPYSTSGSQYGIPSDSYSNLFANSLWVPPNAMTGQNPWVSSGGLYDTSSFAKAEKTDAIWNRDNAFLFSGYQNAVADLDESSDWQQVKKSFLEMEPLKVYPSALSSPLSL